MRPDFRTPAGARAAEHGGALAELAMVIPLMLTLLLVIFDFGQGFLAYISVSNGARDGARAAMLEDVACSVAGVQAAAQNGASPYSVTVSVVESGDRCSVTVTHVYSPILPFVTSSVEMPFMGPVGPLWDGTLRHTMVSQ